MSLSFSFYTENLIDTHLLHASRSLGNVYKPKTSYSFYNAAPDWTERFHNVASCTRQGKCASRRTFASKFPLSACAARHVFGHEEPFKVSMKIIAYVKKLFG